MSPRRPRPPYAHAALLAAAFLLAVAAPGGAANPPTRGAPAPSPADEVRSMFRRVLTSPESSARMTIERSDPFGGEPAREQGTLWLVPGVGLRYRSSERGGQDLVIDRSREVFLLYSPSERVVYRAPYESAPSRLRRLLAEPERFLSVDLRATPERRRVRGAMRDGYRLRSASLGDSLPEVSVWVARESATGLPRSLSVASATDTVWVEFRGWSLAQTARLADLKLQVPPGTKELPLDPRELLERGEGRESR